MSGGCWRDFLQRLLARLGLIDGEGHRSVDVGHAHGEVAERAAHAQPHAHLVVGHQNAEGVHHAFTSARCMTRSISPHELLEADRLGQQRVGLDPDALLVAGEDEVQPRLAVDRGHQDYRDRRIVLADVMAEREAGVGVFHHHVDHGQVGPPLGQQVLGLLPAAGRRSPRSRPFPVACRCWKRKSSSSSTSRRYSCMVMVLLGVRSWLPSHNRLCVILFAARSR